SEGEESEEEERDGDVDQGFREQLMTVLQAGKPPARPLLAGHENPGSPAPQVGEEGCQGGPQRHPQPHQQ
ncbi:MYBBP1A isoform 9, partial [Pan troglodytes]